MTSMPLTDNDYNRYQCILSTFHLLYASTIKILDSCSSHGTFSSTMSSFSPQISIFQRHEYWHWRKHEFLSKWWWPTTKVPYSSLTKRKLQLKSTTAAKLKT